MSLLKPQTDLRLSVTQVFQEGGSWILKTQLLMK